MGCSNLTQILPGFLHQAMLDDPALALHLHESGSAGTGQQDRFQTARATTPMNGHQSAGASAATATKATPSALPNRGFGQVKMENGYDHRALQNGSADAVSQQQLENYAEFMDDVTGGESLVLCRFFSGLCDEGKCVLTKPKKKRKKTTTMKMTVVLNFRLLKNGRNNADSESPNRREISPLVDVGVYVSIFLFLCKYIIRVAMGFSVVSKKKVRKKRRARARERDK